MDIVDGVAGTVLRMRGVDFADVAMAALSAAELEASIVAETGLREAREPATRDLLDTIPILPFDAATARHYGRIVAACGYNRRKAIDRMIAATAIEHGLTLITRNAGDFVGIAELLIEDWAQA